MEIEIGNADTLGDIPPKRGPGRPRKDGSPAQPRGPKRTTAAVKQQALDVCVTAIAMGQVATVAVSSALFSVVIPPDDLLNDEEMILLGDAISAEMLASVRARKWLDRAVKVSPHLALMQACFVIAVPRLKRHNLIPNEDWAKHAREQTESTVPMEAGGTPSDSGGYGFGENYAGTNVIDALGIHDSASV